MAAASAARCNIDVPRLGCIELLLGVPGIKVASTDLVSCLASFLPLPSSPALFLLPLVTQSAALIEDSNANVKWRILADFYGLLLFSLGSPIATNA